MVVGWATEPERVRGLSVVLPGEQPLTRAETKFLQVRGLGVGISVRAHTCPQRNSSIPNGKLPMENLAHNFTIKEKGKNCSSACA